MNFSKLVREKLDHFRMMREPDGIDAVLRHLDAAESRFATACKSGDSELFTDVIYRTNQVFEGILKESYEVLTGKPSEQKTPHQIEQAFTKDSVFTPRVIDYFTMYRRDWRNPSTHDHRLDFSEQEAFLAISNVSSFCFVALDQMITQLAVKKATASREVSATALVSLDAEGLAVALSTALPKLLKERMPEHRALHVSESLLTGYLEGFIKGLAPDFAITRDVMLTTNDRSCRADLVLTGTSATIIVEIKKVIPDKLRSSSRSRRLKDQLASYADSGQATGILCVIFASDLSFDNIPSFEHRPVEGSIVPTHIVEPTPDTKLRSTTKE